MKKLIGMCVILLVGMGTWVMTWTNTYEYSFPQVKSVELRKELVPICGCESQGRQYDSDGKVLRGKKNPNDIGYCQINLTFHQKEAESMGLDLFKKSDNIAFANWLYGKEGSKPWNWSKGCWQ